MLEVFFNPPREQWEVLCRRPSSENPVVRERVQDILCRVREQGDEALRALSLEIDKRPLDAIEVSADEIREASEKVSEPVKRAIAAAEANIRAFHEAQLPQEICVLTAYVKRRSNMELLSAEGDLSAEELTAALRTGRPEDRRETLCHTIACKAAIKAGTRSDPKELETLARAVVSGEVRYCPHGRPVSVKLTKNEMDKQIKRIV